MVKKTHGLELKCRQRHRMDATIASFDRRTGLLHLRGWVARRRAPWAPTYEQHTHIHTAHTAMILRTYQERMLLLRKAVSTLLRRHRICTPGVHPFLCTNIRYAVLHMHMPPVQFSTTNLTLLLRCLLQKLPGYIHTTYENRQPENRLVDLRSVPPLFLSPHIQSK